MVTGNIAVEGGNNNTKVAFKNCAPFRKCRTGINETFIDEAEHINIAMPMYNLTEYSDNYFDTSGSLWQFKRDEAIGNINLKDNNSLSFKHKSNCNTVEDGPNRNKEDVNNFWRSLEMPLINCKVDLSLTSSENCVLSNVSGASTFKIADAKLYIPIVTLSTEDNAKLSNLLSEGFKRSVYWNEYKAIRKI